MKAHEAREVLRADNVLDEVRGLAQRTERLYVEAEATLREARRSKDLRTALAAIREAANVIREARANATLLGELTQQYQPAAPGLGRGVSPSRSGASSISTFRPKSFPELSEEEYGLHAVEEVTPVGD